MPVRKRFGQHFLHDPGVIRRIVESIGPAEGEALVEIGPGRGALTFELLRRSGALEVVEIDRDLAHELACDARATPGLKIHVQDALKTDYLALRSAGPPLRVVGNLPYNISTPLLFELLRQRAAIADMHFMLQKEVVERITSAPGTKEYGRLTVMLAAFAESEFLFDVGPGAFQPPPKVWSAIVRLKPSAHARFDIGSEAALRAVVSAAFSQRRKTLRNCLKGLLDAADIEACGIDPSLRPGVLSPAQFGLLASRHSRLYSNGDAAL
ncbi:MAG TPA: 16S rRNA (adenine(1518)-N(6)/adenine(1519)-N(6))-dimethyltransferase RsmA [Steroidobacteraceae bacterium]|jgi:16S rRNA (adenine1518-N6/adenine1519-N6)-dimethyltransferase